MRYSAHFFPAYFPGRQKPGRTFEFKRKNICGWLKITTTPYYHPLLPLLADLSQARAEAEEWGEWMWEILLLDVPRRQVVFTIPEMLRIFFKYNRRLLGELCRSALRSLTRYFEVLTESEIRSGVIAAIQTFAGRINLNPHLHFLVAEGGVDETGVFHKVLLIDDSRLAELFAREVLGFLVRKELLSPEWAERLLSWRHTGFSVHSRVRAKTMTEAERVGKYMTRPLSSLEGLSLDEQEGQVRYRYGKDAKEKERRDYLEFIARVTYHIHDKGQVTVRYYGLYADAHQGKIKKASLGSFPLRIGEEELRRLPAKG